MDDQRKRILVASVVLVLALAGGVAVFLALGGSNRSRSIADCENHCAGGSERTHIINLKTGVAAGLKQHFSIFRHRTQPSSVRKYTRARGGILHNPQVRNSFGIDTARLRVVSFGHLGAIVAVPGTGGACLEAIRGRRNNGGAGCSGIPQARQLGIFIFSYSAGTDSAGHPTSIAGGYTVGGLAPNGIHTVEVHEPGKTTTLHVKDNAVLGGFANRPMSVSFKNAAGKTITTTS